MADPVWAEFEKLAYEIQRDLAGSAQVTLRDTIQGVDSGIPRQIDISIRQQVGPHAVLIVVDCKDHRAPLDVNVVGEFAAVVRDVRANKGALIASRGFTEAALTLARTYGIDAYNLVDTQNATWKVYVTLPALLERLYVASAKITVFGSAPNSTWLPGGDANLWTLYAEDETSLGAVRDILARKWNSREIPQAKGRHTVVLVEKARVRKTDAEHVVRVVVDVDVAEVHYFGPWPIQTRGFQDAQTGGLITRTFTAEPLSPYEVEQGRVEGWRQIDDPAQLAVRPSIVLGYSDVAPVTTDTPPME